MQVRKWLISGEINYNVCRICSLTLLPPEVLIPTPITLSVFKVENKENTKHACQKISKCYTDYTRLHSNLRPIEIIKQININIKIVK